MEAEERPQGSRLTRLGALHEAPHAHHLYQALRLIEAANPEHPVSLMRRAAGKALTVFYRS